MRRFYTRQLRGRSPLNKKEAAEVETLQREISSHEDRIVKNKSSRKRLKAENILLRAAISDKEHEIDNLYAAAERRKGRK